MATRRLTRVQKEAIARAIAEHAPALRSARKQIGVNADDTICLGEVIAQWAPLRHGLEFEDSGELLLVTVRAGYWTVYVEFEPKRAAARAVGMRQ
ncbi:MAG: hypothetical protein R3200_14760 [Xanthomonadales bacterium]|nr:hypothetical protein [Xanthomonadales bacterium]